MTSFYKHLSIAQEVIDVQNGAFFKELTLVIEPYVGRTLIPQQKLGALATNMSEVIKRHTGATVDVSMVPGGSFFILIPDLARNHVLDTHGNFKDASATVKAIRAAGETKAGVDLKHSKVLGFFTTLRPTMGFDPTMLVQSGENALSAPELAGVVLHEVGHFFTFCELLDRTTRTNQVLAAATRALQDADSTKRQEIIDVTVESLGLAGRSPVFGESLERAGTPLEVASVLLVEAYQDIRTQTTGHAFYDKNSAEVLADQFAARHGAGRYVLTGLDKLYTHFGANYRQNRAAYWGSKLLSVGYTLLIFTAVGGQGGVVGAVFGAIVAALVATAGLFTSERTATTVGGTYDTPRDRVIRIKQDLIAQTKNRHVDPLQTKTLLEDVRILEKMENEYVDHKSLGDLVFSALSNATGFGGKKEATIKLQRDLEELVANPLFLRALQLKHL